MLRSIISSFARAYGRGLGYAAARKTAWLAIPMLILVVVLGLLELSGTFSITQLVGPVMLPHVITNVQAWLH
jgi:hypothetical protein